MSESGGKVEKRRKRRTRRKRIGDGWGKVVTRRLYRIKNSYKNSFLKENEPIGRFSFLQFGHVLNRL